MQPVPQWEYAQPGRGDHSSEEERRSLRQRHKARQKWGNSVDREQKLEVNPTILHAFLKVDVLMLKPRNLNRKDAKYAKQSNAKFTISYERFTKSQTRCE